MATAPREQPTAPDFDVLTLVSAIEDGTAPLIVDTRSRREYEADHIPGAVHLPFWKARFAHRKLEAEPETEILLYCGHGPRAMWAQRSLRKAGYRRVGLLEGHWQAWLRR
jgi:rhodanese-related sulfurtransferase